MFLGIGVCFVGAGIQYVAGLRERRKWPKVEGVLESARVEIVKTEEGNSYLLHTRYRYRVGERELLCTRWSSYGDTPSFWTLGRAEKAREACERNPSRPVFYNPSKPSESFLVNGMDGLSIGCLGLGLFLFLCGGVFMYLDHVFHF